MPRARLRRRATLLAGLGVLLVAIAGGVIVIRGGPGNISHPGVRFVPQAPPPLVPVRQRLFAWPTYGYTPDRTRVIGASIAPPFDVRWASHGSALLEFPPVIWGDSLYVLDDSGLLRRLDAPTGHTRWVRRVGRLAAASPAVGAGGVYAPLLIGPRGSGRVVALDRLSGRVRWSRELSSRTESSPLLIDGVLYVGSEDGRIYALDAATGHVVWTYKAGAAVKGGLALKDGVLYVGDYGGTMYALRRTDGALKWKVGTSGARFGLGSGTFYSTPAVAFGRVYAGNTDDRVYSFAADSGKLAWASQTGDYVYASPAVEDVTGLGPTAYVGSYDGFFYAFDAQSGRVRWRYRAGGKISGSPTIVGRVVYFSDLGTRTTIGLDVVDGHRVWSFPDGAFNPIVTDGNLLYLNGYSTLYGLEPTQPSPPRAAAPPGRPGGGSAGTRHRHRGRRGLR